MTAQNRKARVLANIEEVVKLTEPMNQKRVDDQRTKRLTANEEQSKISRRRSKWPLTRKMEALLSTCPLSPLRPSPW